MQLSKTLTFTFIASLMIGCTPIPEEAATDSTDSAGTEEGSTGRMDDTGPSDTTDSRGTDGQTSTSSADDTGTEDDTDSTETGQDDIGETCEVPLTINNLADMMEVGCTFIASPQDCAENVTVSRGQLVDIVTDNLLPMEQLCGFTTPSNPTFTDVGDMSPYYLAVEQAVYAQLVIPEERTSAFMPGEKVDECFFQELTEAIDMLPDIFATRVESPDITVPPGFSFTSGTQYLLCGVGLGDINPFTDMTVVNNLDGDFDVPMNTQVITSVRLRCRNSPMDNYMTGGIVNMVNGEAETNLPGCYDDNNGDGMEYLIQFNTSGGAMVGDQVRLGAVAPGLQVRRQGGPLITIE